MKLTFLQRNAYSFGRGLAAVVWPFFVGRRRIAVENLLKCRVAADESEARRIARSSFCHFAGHIAEALFLPGAINRENYPEFLDTEGAAPGVVRLLLEEPKEPIILVSSHHGCWEAATNILSLVRPMIAIARVMDNRFLADWMKKHHFRGPVTVINRNDGFRERIMRQWFETNAAFTILTDQHTYGGAMLKFFGRPARTVTSAARLAIRYGYPVVVGSFVRVGPMRYRLVGGEPLVFPKSTTKEEAAQILNDRLEEAIRAYPDQYFWIHRRWRDD